MDAIKYAANSRAYITQRTNFLILESVAQHNAPYAIFFDLPEKLLPVTFATIVDYVFKESR